MYSLYPHFISALHARKQAEIDRKKAEVRARLEAQAAGKKAKKGFMTPERKKKLRVSQHGRSSLLLSLFSSFS